jgi:hypothetical protein
LHFEYMPLSPLSHNELLLTEQLPMNFDVPTDFFLECLRDNSADRPLFIEKSIVAAAGPSSVLSTEDLDLPEYVELGLCDRQLRSDPRPETTWRWGGEDEDRLFALHNQAIWDVNWRGHALVVCELAWSTSCGPETRYWIVAENPEIGREFILDVARKTNDPGEALLVFAGGRWRRSRELYQVTAAASFDDLVLAGELKASIRQDFARFLAARAVRDSWARLAARGAVHRTTRQWQNPLPSRLDSRNPNSQPIRAKSKAPALPDRIHDGVGI